MDVDVQRATVILRGTADSGRTRRLTEELVDWFSAHRVAVTVSMDGPKALHDKNRKTVGGKGTYEVVAAKARMLLARHRTRPVGARVTLIAAYPPGGGAGTRSPRA